MPLRKTSLVLALGGSSLLSFSALAAAEAPVATPVVSIEQRPVTIYSVDSATVLEQRHDPEGPMGSGGNFVTILLKGTYEGNLCGGDGVAFEKEFVGSWEQPAYKMRLKSYSVTKPDADPRKRLQIHRDVFLLENAGCPMFSSPTPFAIKTELYVSMWNSDWTRREWTYAISGGNAEEVVKTLKVVFEVGKGFTVSLQ